MSTKPSISHDRQDETPEAKARWFRSLSMAERMEMLCEFTDLAVSIHPGLQERKHAQPIAGRIQVISGDCSINTEYSWRCQGGMADDSSENDSWRMSACPGQEGT